MTTRSDADPDASGVLDQMICFSLYTASRTTTQAYRRLLAPWGLTYPQYLVLVRLWTSGPRTVGELGDDLGLDSGTLSPLLRRLERDGIVSRARVQVDGRVVTVSLTERGERLRSEMADVPAELFACMNLSLGRAHDLLDALHSLTMSVTGANTRADLALTDSSER